MKKLGFLFISLLFAGVLFAQNVAITFDKTSHDFGKIKEQDGLATITFTVKNTGTEPLVISRVQASCGCTTPTWTKDPILPGKTGTITASYNPANRPGTFVKTISVFSNAGTEAKLLTIKGEVIPKPAVAP
jgi:archaellum component FlaG (FlaF/FlaG flagellin family)